LKPSFILILLLLPTFTIRAQKHYVCTYKTHDADSAVEIERCHFEEGLEPDVSWSNGNIYSILISADGAYYYFRVRHATTNYLIATYFDVPYIVSIKRARGHYIMWITPLKFSPAHSMHGKRVFILTDNLDLVKKTNNLDK